MYLLCRLWRADLRPTDTLWQRDHLVRVLLVVWTVLAFARAVYALV